MRHLRKFASLLAMAVVLAVSGEAAAQLASVIDSPHNLAARTAETTDVCVFCHTPHAGNQETAPLWNKPNTVPAGFQTYDSVTLDGTVALTTASQSMACLVCHDGTQAMDTVINAPGTDGINLAGSTFLTASLAGTLDSQIQAGRAADLTQDLRDDHPIAIQYAGGNAKATAVAGTGFLDPDFKNVSGTLSTGGFIDLAASFGAGGNPGARDKTDVILYENATANLMVECGSCHDPHMANTADAAGDPALLGNNDAGSAVSFMRAADVGALCTACHNK